MRNVSTGLKLCASLFLLFAFQISIQAQEICDNGIDDDGDGLIDLNDITDCSCFDLMNSSLIPNPSFEEMSDCPNNEAQLNFANDWIQASEATTDYVHTCGVLGNPFLGFEAPLPFPDGEGGIGFRDGKPNAPNFKEYTGAYLTEPMSIGTEYRLDFFVGFHSDPGSLDFDMAIFGSTNGTDAIPFGIGDTDFGCPTNGAGWTQLGTMSVSGINEWKNVVFDFVADQEYATIVIGPDCAINPNSDSDPYFFFDRLVLAESIMFEIPLASISGSLCSNNLEVTSSDAMNGTFQWFNNGIALVGETSQSLSITSPGNYQVIVTTPTGCFAGELYEAIDDQEIITEEFASICQGDTLTVGVFELTVDGSFVFSGQATNGCDSMHTIWLTVINPTFGSLDFDACANEVITVNNITYDLPGLFTQNLEAASGCDSVLTINITELEGFTQDVDLNSCEGVPIIFNGVSYDVSGTYLQTVPSPTGCDSTYNIFVSIGESMTENQSYSICEGESIVVNNQSYNAAGNYTQSVISPEGCENILNIEITSATVINTSIDESFCQGFSFTYNNSSLTESGSYSFEFISQSGCDSIVTLNLTENAAFSSAESYSFCEGDNITINGENYSVGGNYTQSMTTIAGCDSTLNLSLIMLPAAEFIKSFEICEGDTLIMNGEPFLESGTYSQLFTASNGCDSTLIINLNVEEICETCMFDHHYQSNEILIEQTDKDLFVIELISYGKKQWGVELDKKQAFKFLALLVVDVEIQFNKSNISHGKLVKHQNNIVDYLQECHWEKGDEFSKNNLAKNLGYSEAELAIELNNNKLRYLYEKLIVRLDRIEKGGKFSYTLR